MIDAYLTDRMMPVPDGCVLWTGPVNADGYASYQKQGPDKGRLAHRVMWKQAHGPLPDAIELDHLCRQRSCMEMAHLEPVTQAVNKQRAWGMPDADTCRMGHQDWRQIRTTGQRECRTCRNARQRRGTA